ncbi:uncharacterized protein LOC134928708 [Pseudophryne corroboree]|uniref:uncharacterized protein LOC134928708 n=1 Tax=Pseudophryne corroboree TaxID=495146 RepID=UPI003081D300
MIVVENVPGRKFQLLWPDDSKDDGEERATPVDSNDNRPPFSGGDSHNNHLGQEPPCDKDPTIASHAEAVVDKVVSHLERWHFEGGYRQLRIFSGITPVPAGEETYELWREAAIQHSEEWQCPEHIKRQRVVESLRGPAMGVIQATRRSNTQATLTDYIEALDFSYGTLEDVGDLLARLNSTYQEYGETLTHYIYRVDRLIYKIVDKGGIDKEQVDERRIKQVLKGALTNSPIAQKLRCTLSKTTPPTLNELVREVKVEEVQIENREKTIKKVKVVLPATDKTNLDERLLKLLEEQNKKIDQLIALQEDRSSSIRSDLPSGMRRGVNRRVGNRSPIICYSCGQPGHRSFECPVNSNSRGGNYTYTRRRTEPVENSQRERCDPLTGYPIINVHAMGSALWSDNIPGSLMGPAPLVKALVNGHECTVLIDSGSQVSIIFESWYQSHLTDVPIQPLSGLTIWGLSEQKYPYLGYVVTRITFEPGLITPNETVLLVALVCPDSPGDNGKLPVIVGTNTNMFKNLSNWCDKQVVDKGHGNSSNGDYICQKIDSILEASGSEATTGEGIDQGSPALDTCFHGSDIDHDSKIKLLAQLQLRESVFSKGDWDLGTASGVEHNIKLMDDTPFRERSRRLAPADFEDVRKHLKGLLENHVIADSESPYASPSVVARKKNGEIRLCIDYRTLNNRTIPDQYTVPKIDEALDCLQGSQWFSVLDLRSGYYQIPMSADDRAKTAFICPIGFFEFLKMPQGIKGAPATFQRMMEKTVGDMCYREVLVYLDDIIVFGNTLEEHNERLLKVLDRLQARGLKLSVEKCQLCQSVVKYLGHIVSRQGISTDPDKVTAVVNWPRPNSLKDLRSFLGFCGYYRKFVPLYSKIVQPLTELTKGYPPNNKKITSKQMGEHRYFRPHEPFGERWNIQCEDAFQKLKQSLTEAPVLAYADPSLPYTVHIDASYEGLGGILYQAPDNRLKPISYVSRGLSGSEKNYPVHKLEFLALKWAIVDKFHDYLYGVPFTVHTDNNPLTYIQTTAKLDATGHRWLAALSNYNFTIKYKPGVSNQDADALSRMPHREVHIVSEEWVEVPAATVKGLCNQINIIHGSLTPAIVTMGVSNAALPNMYCWLNKSAFGGLEIVDSQQMIREQQADNDIFPIIRMLGHPHLPVSNDELSTKSKVLSKQVKKLIIHKGILYRRSIRMDGTYKMQLVLPEKYKLMVLQALHDGHGHLGYDKTQGLVSERFYWPFMNKEIDQYCKTCGNCIVRKKLPEKSAPLVNITSTGPMELVCIDFLALEDPGG